MESNLDKIAQELYGKLETRFSEITLGDKHSDVLSKEGDIPKSRFFEFQYKDNGVALGTITITLDEKDNPDEKSRGIIVQISGDLADRKHPGVFNFIRGIRQFAKDNLLNFTVKNIGKDNLDKRDYEFQAKPKEEPVMPQTPMMESSMYGTSKISYQDLGNARLVIKHTQNINPELAAGRTMHIENIYVENAEGERFRYPYKHLNGARALAEHLKHGGNPYDSIGKHISSLSEELAQLRKFKGYVGRQAQLSEAMSDITSKVMERIEQVKKEVQMLQRPAYYESFAESFEDQEEQAIPEEVMNDWVDRLTIRTFNEELKTAFPYIFRLVDESEIPTKELNPEDMLNELRSEEKDEEGNVVKWKEEGEWKKIKGKAKDPRGQVTHASDKARKETEKMTKEEIELESFFDKFISEDDEQQQGRNELLNKKNYLNALNSLKDKLGQGLLKSPGPRGINAALELKGILDSDKFVNQYLSTLSDNDDVGTAIKLYLNDLATGDEHEPMSPDAQDVAKQILDSGELNDLSSDEPADSTPAPAVPPAPPVAATPPVAPIPPEAGIAPADLSAELPPLPPTAPSTPAPAAVAESKIKAKIIKALECGATHDTPLDFGSHVITIGEAMKRFKMLKTESDPVDEIWKTVEGFFNPEDDNFTIGGERAKIRVIRDFKNGAFDHVHAKPEHVRAVLEKIDEIDPSTGIPHHDESHRIRKLAGIKSAEMDEQQQQQFDLNTLMAQLQALQNDPNAQQQMGNQVKQVLGQQLQKVQKDVPNQTVQFPGGSMNPAEMMKGILGQMDQIGK